MSIDVEEDTWNSPKTIQKIKEVIAELREGRVGACFISKEAKKKAAKQKKEKSAKETESAE